MKNRPPFLPEPRGQKLVQRSASERLATIVHDRCLAEKVCGNSPQLPSKVLSARSVLVFTVTRRVKVAEGHRQFRCQQCTKCQIRQGNVFNARQLFKSVIGFSVNNNNNNKYDRHQSPVQQSPAMDLLSFWQ